MHLIVMGTGPFAVPMFQSLLDSHHTVAGLVTRPVLRRRAEPKAQSEPSAAAQVPPTAPKESTTVAASSPMHDEAVRRGLPVFAPENINSTEAQEYLRSTKADLFVVCDYGQILKSATLRLARMGGINLHGSLLPKYRGAAPIHWALYNGEEETGVTAIHMTPKLDGGPRLAWRSVRIGPNETSPEVEARLSELGVEAVNESLRLLENWDGTSPMGEPQNPQQVILAPRLTRQDGVVHWNRSARQIANQVRAFKPWPATYTYVCLPGKPPLRIIIDQVRVVDEGSSSAAQGEAAQGEAAPGEAAPGEVVFCNGRELHIATGDGVLAIEAVQPSGKRVMAIREFLNGNRLSLGDRFEVRE